MRSKLLKRIAALTILATRQTVREENRRDRARERSAARFCPRDIRARAAAEESRTATQTEPAARVQQSLQPRRCPGHRGIRLRVNNCRSPPAPFVTRADNSGRRDHCERRTLPAAAVDKYRAARRFGAANRPAGRRHDRFNEPRAGF